MDETTTSPDPREAARRALEGAEHTAKREAEEKTRSAREELDQLNQRLTVLRQEKEKLELAWIDLDGKKKALRTLIAPLADEEKRLEETEAKLETEEAATGVPEARHELELKREAAEAERKLLEEKKWAEESKIVTIDKTIEANTKQYRELLEEEDRITARVEQLKAEALL